MGRRDACFRYNFEELTTLELELSHMYAELEKSLDNPSSALRMFLHNTPEAVRSLLDNCIVILDSNSDNHNIGKVVFDFFLFHKADKGNCELALVDLVIATGKKKLLEHPLFETFIRLKWIKVWKVYSATFAILCLFMIALVGHTLLSFSTFFEESNELIKGAFSIFLLTMTVLMFLLHVAKLQHILFKNCLPTDIKRSPLSDWTARQERLYPIMDTITPILGFFILFNKDSWVAVFLILYSSWQFMRSLTMFPRVGKNVFITSRVTRTISEFFLCYLIEILAFTLAFHLLLNHERSIFK